ncbi:MAG TPA: ABC transporter permease [Acidimicrobiales bacterium]|nr:ABC transporter permease [Acidimicrobiales bacterium]
MTFIQQLYNALAVGSIYVAVALGITLIYGLTRIVNFAHGQLLTLGSYLTFELVRNDVPFFVAVLVAMVSVAIVGEVLDLLFFRRTLSNPLNGFVISLGLIVAIQSLVVLIWGPEQQSVAAPFDGVFRVGDLTFDQPRLLLLVATIVVVIALFVLLERTKPGRGIRALAEDPTAARLVGVPVSPYISLTFLLGSGIAAMAGGLLAATFPFNAYSGFEFVLKGFAVAIIGGLGSVPGAVVAALILSLAETIGAAYFALAWAPAFGLVATALIILVRPAGLFRGAGSGGSSHFTLGDHEAKIHARHVLLRAREAVLPWWRREIPGRLTIALAALALVIAPTALATARSLSVATHMVILMIAAYAFWFPFRHAGIFSMAPAAMIGTGAYTAAVALSRWDLGFWVQAPLAMLAATAVALVMGFIALRTSTSYFVILTLVLSQLCVLVFLNWKSVTRGAFGIVTTRPPDDLGPLSFDTAESFYFLAVGFLFLTVLALALIHRTRYGQRLVALRENEALARSLGINAFRDKLTAFAIFGAISGLSGALLFHYLRFIEPGSFSIYLAINVQLIVLLGGVGVWLGPAIGAAVFSFLPEVLDLDPVQSELAYGVVLVMIIVLMPMGLGGMARRTYLWLRSPKDEPPTRTVSATAADAATDRRPRPEKESV